MALTGTHKFVDTSQSTNGDGSASNPYNDIDYACDQAPSSPSSESDRWIIWVRRLSSSISLSGAISPSNPGGIKYPHLLIGWPIKVTHSGYTVDSVPSGTDSLGFSNAQWQFVDSALTEDDNYWVDAEVEFTSGSNNGLKRKVIWFDASSDTIYLDFPLPNNISAGDKYTITLQTEFYDDRPTAPSGWDSDSNPRPMLDGSNSIANIFNFNQPYWQLYNFRARNVTDRIFYTEHFPNKCVNCLFDTADGILRYPQQRGFVGKKIYGWDFSDTARYLGAFSFYTNYAITAELEDVHLQAKSGITSYGLTVGCNLKLKNCTFGRVQSFGGADIARHAFSIGYVYGENVLLASTSKVDLNVGSGDYDVWKRGYIAISGYNGDNNKFHWWNGRGEIYNLDETATIDPPSGASTFIKLSPSSNCSSNMPLEYSEQRYQSSGSKTYTWKFYPVNMSLGATDLEVEAWYLDESSGTHRAYATANPSTYSDDGWHDLSITINPGQAGTVYFKIKLKKYNTSGCYVALDPKVDVS